MNVALPRPDRAYATGYSNGVWIPISLQTNVRNLVRPARS